MGRNEQAVFGLRILDHLEVNTGFSRDKFVFFQKHSSLSPYAIYLTHSKGFQWLVYKLNNSPQSGSKFFLEATLAMHQSQPSKRNAQLSTRIPHPIESADKKIQLS